MRETIHDLRLCAALVFIWIASAITPVGSKAQLMLRDAAIALGE